jgi:hypothetical protein
LKEDGEALKKMKTTSESKALTPKKRKLVVESLEEMKTQDVLKPIASPSSSTAEISEILKVMTILPIHTTKSSRIGTDQPLTEKGGIFGCRRERRGPEEAAHCKHITSD